MSTLYTRNGRPLRRSGDNLYAASGIHVARVRGSKAYGPDGRYVGTLVRSRMVYRASESAAIRSPFARFNRAGSAAARSAASGLYGEEPPIPD